MNTLAVTFTKIMVSDLDAAESFYREALGLTVTGRHFAGEGELSQELRALSTTSKPEDSRLALGRYLERTAPAPGAAWIGFLVADVDATLAAVVKAGGKVVKSPANEPAHGVRAAIACDPDGHLLDIAQALAS